MSLVADALPLLFGVDVTKTIGNFLIDRLTSLQTG